MASSIRNLEILSFDNAESALSAGRNPDSRTIANNTTLERIDADTIGVKLHHTIIVRIHRDGTYTLNSAGWHTTTTWQRINALSPASIGSVKGEAYAHTMLWYSTGAPDWTVDDERLARVPFYDGMRVDSNGHCADMRDAMPIPDGTDPDDWSCETAQLRAAEDTGIAAATGREPYRPFTPDADVLERMRTDRDRDGNPTVFTRIGAMIDPR